MDSIKSKYILWGGVYDVLMTAGFATPWTAQMKLTLMSNWHQILGLSGEALPHPTAVQMLFINFSGLVVLMWGGYRVYHPTVLTGAIDTVGRLAAAALMVRAISFGATPLVGIFLVGELIWFLIQTYGIWVALKKRSI